MVIANPGIPQRMKALRLMKYNANYELKRDVPTPTPKLGEVLVKVAASGFCHTDYQVYEGVYKTELPATPSHEPAGTIVQLGEAVSSDWQVGHRVGVINFKNPCGSCSGCKWRKSAGEQLDARYCKEKSMAGITTDGGFAEYMIAPAYTLVRLPEALSFQQAAPLMCAGATVWNAIRETGLPLGSSIAIVGIGGLGVLGIQFAKALGYDVVAIDNRQIGLRLASGVKAKPDLILDYGDKQAGEKILQLTSGIGLDGAVICTDDAGVANWATKQLRPRGVCVVLGLPTEGYRFYAFTLVFNEIVVKGALHASRLEVERMVETVAEHNIESHLTLLPIDEAEALPEKVAARDFEGRLVVTI
ncbi:hypothetical protein Q7P37_010392 [Cladosporium fusiforme]